MQTDAPDAPDFNGASVPPSDTVAAAVNRVSSLPAGVHDTVVTAAATMAAQQTHLLMAAEQARRKASEANVLAQAKVQAAQTAQKKLLAAQQLALFREAVQAADIKQQLHEAAAAQAAAVASVQAQLAFMPKEDFAAAKISQGRAVQAQVSGSLGIGNGGAADGAALAAMLGVGNGAGVAMPAAGVGAGVSVAAGGNASDSPLLSALMSENKRLTTENAQLTTELALTARVLMDKHSLLEKADDTIRDLRAVMADGAGSGGGEGAAPQRPAALHQSAMREAATGGTEPSDEEAAIGLMALFAKGGGIRGSRGKAPRTLHATGGVAKPSGRQR